jgi:ribonuclease P/MRP protein subunit RPP1
LFESRLRHHLPRSHPAPAVLDQIQNALRGIKSGKRLELSYAQGVMGDSGMRRNLISNATQLIRASRGRGLIISSEAKGAVACRGPWDAINLAAVWGLGQEKGYEAMSKECRSVVVNGRLKRTSYRGVIDVVYGGERPAVPAASAQADAKTKQDANGKKRKAEVMEGSASSTPVSGEGEGKLLSKRQMRRQAHQARLRAAEADAESGVDGQK